MQILKPHIISYLYFWCFTPPCSLHYFIYSLEIKIHWRMRRQGKVFNTGLIKEEKKNLNRSLVTTSSSSVLKKGEQIGKINKTEENSWEVAFSTGAHKTRLSQQMQFTDKHFKKTLAVQSCFLKLSTTAITFTQLPFLFPNSCFKSRQVFLEWRSRTKYLKLLLLEFCKVLSQNPFFFFLLCSLKNSNNKLFH